MTHKLLTHLQISAVGEEIRPASRADGVTSESDARPNTRITQSPLHHFPGINTAHTTGSESFTATLGAAEKVATFVFRETRYICRDTPQAGDEPEFRPQAAFASNRILARQPC